MFLICWVVIFIYSASFIIISTNVTRKGNTYVNKAIKEFQKKSKNIFSLIKC